MLTIIGGGPAGNYLAYLLSRAGAEVEVIEEHSEIGRPVQCAGIISERLKEFFSEEEIGKFLVNKVHKARIYSPDGNFAETRLKENYVIDRAKFDSCLAEKAKSHGARFLLGTQFLGFRKKKGRVVITLRKGRNVMVKETDILVGADGPLSKVAECMGLKRKRFFFGIQARANLKNENMVEFFLFPQGIGWVIPENTKTARVGIAATRNANETFKRFAEKRLGSGFRKKVIEYNAGLIPVYDPKMQTQAGRVFLLGDSAGMTKATTLGGIIQGLTAARALAHSTLNNKSYDHEWKKKMGLSLRMSLLLRKMMDRFSEKDFNKLIGVLSKERNRKLLDRLDREAPTKFITKLMLREPSLIYFARFLFKKSD